MKSPEVGVNLGGNVNSSNFEMDHVGAIWMDEVLLGESRGSVNVNVLEV